MQEIIENWGEREDKNLVTIGWRETAAVLRDGRFYAGYEFRSLELMCGLWKGYDELKYQEKEVINMGQGEPVGTMEIGECNLTGSKHLIYIEPYRMISGTKQPCPIYRKLLNIYNIVTSKNGDFSGPPGGSTSRMTYPPFHISMDQESAKHPDGSEWKEFCSASEWAGKIMEQGLEVNTHVCSYNMTDGYNIARRNAGWEGLGTFYQGGAVCLKVNIFGYPAHITIIYNSQMTMIEAREMSKMVRAEWELPNEF